MMEEGSGGGGGSGWSLTAPFLRIDGGWVDGGGDGGSSSSSGGGHTHY